MEIYRNKNNKYWYKYFIPKLISDKGELPIYKWLFWNIKLNKQEQQDMLLKQGQHTFIYCPYCDNELISSDSFVKDTDYVYYKCSKCGAETKWDFDFLCPILVEYNDKSLGGNKDEDKEQC